VPTPGHASIKAVVRISREDVPLTSLSCLKESLDRGQINTLSQKRPEPGPERHDSLSVDVVVERGLSYGQEWKHFLVDGAVSLEGHRPGVMVMVRSRRPLSSAIFADEIC
jgi:hypothetical protein